MTKLTEFPLDHSIALAFQERAEELLESGTLDGASAATDALAAYVGVLATPLAVPTPTKAELTLTLVRWPYT